MRRGVYSFVWEVLGMLVVAWAQMGDIVLLVAAWAGLGESTALVGSSVGSRRAFRLRSRVKIFRAYPFDVRRHASKMAEDCQVSGICHTCVYLSSTAAAIMPSKLVIALALSPAAALQLPGVGEVALKLPHKSSVPRDAISQFAAAQRAPRSSVSTAAAARGNAQHLRCKGKGDPRGTRARAAAGARANKNPTT